MDCGRGSGAEVFTRFVRDLREKNLEGKGRKEADMRSSCEAPAKQGGRRRQWNRLSLRAIRASGEEMRQGRGE